MRSLPSARISAGTSKCPMFVELPMSYQIFTAFDPTRSSRRMLSAADNMRLLDRVGSNAVKIWYDIGNSTNMGHFDVPAEIRALGKERICQIHIKDQVLLGTGKVDVKGAIQAMHDIGYDGWCVFETAASAADRSGDAEKNLKVFRQIEASTL